ELNSTIDAHVASGAAVTASSAAQIEATDDGTIRVLTGGAAAGTGFGAGAAALSKNDITDVTEAYVADATVSAPTIEITAANSQSIQALSLGGAGAEDAALGGSVSLNNISSRADAHAEAGSHLTAATSLLVQATDSPTIDAIAGAGSGAGDFSVAASVGTNTIRDTVTAYIDSSAASAPTI